MGTFSQNTTIKIEGSIAAASSSISPSLSATLYTAPSNSYAEVVISIGNPSSGFNTTGGGRSTLEIGGQDIASIIGTGANTAESTLTGAEVNGISGGRYPFGKFKVGPGQAVVVKNFFDSDILAYIQGVEFKNSP